MVEQVDSFKTVYHVDNGPTKMYKVDAANAVSQHPDEWSNEPWAHGDAQAARANRQKRYDEDVARAKEAGQPLPPPLPPLLELTPEEQETVDADAKARAEAAERVRVRKEKDEKARLEEMQYQADLTLLANPPPAIDPTQRRPFGRKGPLTPAERAAVEKKAAAAKAKPDEIEP